MHLIYLRQWNKDLLQNVLTGLPSILNTADGKPDDKYKLALAAGFFHKFFHGVQGEMVFGFCFYW